MQSKLTRGLRTGKMLKIPVAKYKVYGFWRYNICRPSGGFISKQDDGDVGISEEQILILLCSANSAQLGRVRLPSNRIVNGSAGASPSHSYFRDCG
jgi:hypothetical protein